MPKPLAHCPHDKTFETGSGGGKADFPLPQLPAQAKRSAPLAAREPDGGLRTGWKRDRGIVIPYIRRACRFDHERPPSPCSPSFLPVQPPCPSSTRAPSMTRVIPRRNGRSAWAEAHRFHRARRGGPRVQNRGLYHANDAAALAGRLNVGSSRTDSRFQNG